MRVVVVLVQLVDDKYGGGCREKAASGVRVRVGNQDPGVIFIIVPL